MKIAIAQLNPLVGDIATNAQEILSAAQTAAVSVLGLITGRNFLLALPQQYDFGSCQSPGSVQGIVLPIE